MFRQGSCQGSPVEESGEHKRLRRSWRQEARQKAVLGARRPVGKPSWAPGGPSEGRLGRQEARREAWAPGSPSGGRLGRQEVRREAVLGARSPESSVLPTVAAKMQVLRRLQAAVARTSKVTTAQTGGPDFQSHHGAKR